MRAADMLLEEEVEDAEVEDDVEDAEVEDDEVPWTPLPYVAMSK